MKTPPRSYWLCYGAVIFLFYLGCTPAKAQPTALLIDSNLETFLYRDGKTTKLGKIVAPLNPNMPWATTPRLLFKTAAGYFVSLRNRGMYHSSDGRSWQKVATFTSQNSLLDPPGEREVTAYDSNTGYYSHKHSLGKLENNHPKPISHNLSSHVYFSALAVSANKIYLGTTTNGLYAAELGKPSLVFKTENSGLPYIPHNDKHYLYEEISVLKIAPDGALWAATSIQGGIFRRQGENSSFYKIPSALDSYPTFATYDMAFSTSGKIYISTNHGLLVGNQQALSQLVPWSELLPGLAANITGLLLCLEKEVCLAARLPGTTMPPEKAQRLKQAHGRKLFYSSAQNYKKNSKAVQALLKRGFYNGMVLDVKDDHGYLRYDSQVAFAKKIGAVRPLVNLSEIVQFMKEHNLYLSARIVVFKDPVLFKQKGFAILDRRSQQPWQGTAHEYWVDPYHPEIAPQYYVPLVQELTALGVDEIQLDYIRFPSDGLVKNCLFSHRKADSYPSEALANFLWQLRQATSLPIMADVYGYHGIYRAAGVIGQDVEVYGEILDVIAPMLYPSHFGDRYLTHLPFAERAYRLLYHSAQRYQHLANGKFLVRPWLQAFPMKNSLWSYGKDYFAAQIQGGAANGVSGYMFWGTFEHMLAVEKALRQ